MHVLRAVRRSPLGLDLYLWLTYRTFHLKAPLRLTWPQALPAVRRGPGQGERCANTVDNLPHGLFARVKKNSSARGRT